MIKNYIKLAWRTLLKNRMYSLIIVSGLGLGYAACIIIYLHVRDELSYDRYHADPDRIYRVVKDFVNDDGTFLPDATTTPALAPGILAEIPEVEAAIRIIPNWGDKYLVRRGDKVFYEEKRFLADSTIFKIFKYEFLEGDEGTALSKPGNVVITESMAIKYFGDESPIGKDIEIGEGNNRLKTVSAVIRDIPSNSHFHFDLLLPLPPESGQWSNNWGWYNWYTYIKLKQEATIADVEPKIIALFKKNRPQSNTRYYTQALTDIHLRSKLKWELEPNGDISFVNIFITIGIFIILIASINYINLSISQAFNRSKEVGIRKVSGAYGGRLINQFLTESVLTSVVALVFGIAVVELSLPYLNAQFGKNILPLSDQPAIIMAGIITGAILLGIVSGLYPSLYLSAFKPVQVLKGVFQPGNQNLWLRKGLVILQFAISVALIAGTFIVIRQVDFLQSKDLGFEKDQVVIVENAQYLSRGTKRVMKNEFMKVSHVETVGGSNGILGGQNWTTGMAAKGSENSLLINLSGIDYEYIPTMKLEIIKGRNFSRDFPSDTVRTIILNETALRDLGIQGDPIGAMVTDNPGEDTLRFWTVIGVLKDFHFANLRNEIKPFVFYLSENASNNFAVKLDAENAGVTLEGLEKAWRAVAPDRPFEYFFLDETFQALYKAEENFKLVFSTLTLMAIYIACSGLFAIASFFIRRRTKEIGIRKVMGATVRQITWLVSAEFLVIILLANLIAWPVAYYFMEGWLKSFANRIDIGFMSFLIAGLFALLIAVFTISFQSIRSAMANPIHSLRNE